ncbi:MAG: Holliday junction resolvase RuvX [Kiritimatiellae bacterium]|nr:Holliday junction resolvase RuvX [Kiritimatiellia bacterium]MCO5061304.1 Holliday junction resolvase RuvX [Kiritimatiellia bacterium]MCO6400186.1 Holliday junction resolvase RuvX [Verrucomicrobiota bacterium]
MPRWLGIDLGEKRVGIAISDPDGFLASAREVCELKNPNEALNRVTEIFRASGATGVVVGLPLNMDGSRGPAAQKATQFAEDLKTRLNVPVKLWDERLTTKTAHDVMIQGGARREKRRVTVDKLAAQLMLQSFLDAHTALPPL